VNVSSRAWLLALTLLAGCSVGHGVKNYPPAEGPAGATVKLGLTGNRTVSGELLAAEDSSLTLLSDGQLVRVELSLIQTGNVPKLSFTGAELRKGGVRERLRLISRYPQGISPDLETRLLQAYGQAAVQEPSRGPGS
jgi:hypothetical protein